MVQHYSLPSKLLPKRQMGGKFKCSSIHINNQLYSKLLLCHSNNQLAFISALKQGCGYHRGLFITKWLLPKATIWSAVRSKNAGRPRPELHITQQKGWIWFINRLKLEMLDRTWPSVHTCILLCSFCVNNCVKMALCRLFWVDQKHYKLSIIYTLCTYRGRKNGHSSLNA